MHQRWLTLCSSLEVRVLSRLLLICVFCFVQLHVSSVEMLKRKVLFCVDKHSCFSWSKQLKHITSSTTALRVKYLWVSRTSVTFLVSQKTITDYIFSVTSVLEATLKKKHYYMYFLKLHSQTTMPQLPPSSQWPSTWSSTSWMREHERRSMSLEVS